MNEFSVKTIVYSGENILGRIGEVIAEINVSKILLCTDKFLCTTQAYKTIVESLEQHNISYKLYTKIQPEPIDTDCDYGAAFCKEHNIELIVAFGGGSVIDQSKAMGAIVTNGKSCRELEGFFVEKPMLPLICVPTTAGTGSEITHVAVITNTQQQYKMTIMDRNNLSPTIAICDENVLCTLPQSLIASCGIDALTHAIEAYTSKKAHHLTDAMALYSIKLISKHIFLSYENPDDKSSLNALMSGSTMAGIAFANSNVGAVHAIAEVVGAKYHIPHGVANAIFLPYVIEYNISGNEERFAQIACEMGIVSSEFTHEEQTRKLISYIQCLIATMKIPLLSSFNDVDTNDFLDLSIKAANNELSLDNPRETTTQMYLDILWSAYNGKIINKS